MGGTDSVMKHAANHCTLTIQPGVFLKMVRILMNIVINAGVFIVLWVLKLLSAVV